MYERFFGLEEEPFRLTPDPRYLYLSRKHAEALAHLRLGLSESSGFVCITGEVGTGKTTLLRTFLGELGPNVAAAYTFVPPVSALELLRRICREFRVTPAGDSQSDLLDALQAFLEIQHAAGRRCIVILDEAQALSIELLEQVRLLLNFETTREKLLRIVLVGQPQLRKLLLAPELAQLNQRITLRWHLGPLSRRETAAYIGHRLSVASGGRITRLLTSPAIRLLHAVSGGVPRLLNMIAHRALLTAFIARDHRVRRRAVALAYHEIQSVPLPGTLSGAYRAAVALAGLAAGVVLFALAVPEMQDLVGDKGRAPESVAVAASTTGIPAAPRPVGGGVSVALAPSAIEPIPVAVAPDDPPVTTPANGPPISTSAQLRAKLVTLDPTRCASASIDRLLASWRVHPLAKGEDTADVDAIAWRRGLQSISFTANRGMLRLLDVPAQLAIRVPGYVVPRAVTLVRVDGTRWTLDVAGSPVTVEGGTLDELWAGQARVVWRDFESLGPVLAAGARGTGVMRLQQLLTRAGAFASPATGVFDATTERAVQQFQRDHQLEVDGRVGAFTRVLLYQQVADYQHPTLADPGAS
jgi:general secretion pathway protein A